MISAETIKQLRDITGAGVIECKKALEETGGDIEKAKLVLKERGVLRAAKKQDRETSDGLVHAYIHNTEKVGAMIKVLCETDFVAKTSDFRELVHLIAMQAAATKPADLNTLVSSPYIKDSTVTINDLITQTVAKLGENIKIAEFSVFEI